MLRLLLLALCLGCGPSTHTGEGEVVTLEPPLHLTIDHGEIPGVMGAMRMRFPVRAPEVLGGVLAGTRVRFEVVIEGDQVVVTRITPLARAGAPRAGIHDHTPHHGGVVTMVGLLHVEAVAAPSGQVRIYLSDVWRQPLPAASATGEVTLDLPDGRRSFALAANGDALEAAGPRPAGSTVRAQVRLERTGNPPVDMNFVLPLGAATPGAASPNAGCVPVTPPAPGSPRCTIAYPTPITALVSAPDGATVFVAVGDFGVSAWHLPAVTLGVGFVIPQPAVPPGAPVPHDDSAQDLAVSPDGRELAAVLPTRVLIFETTSGRLARKLPSPGDRLRRVAWAPDGGRLLVSTFADPVAYLMRPADGVVVGRLPIDGDAAGVAITADGAYAAVGTEAGTIFVFDLRGGAPPRRLSEAYHPVEYLTFGGERLWTVGADGSLRAWTTAAGNLVVTRRLDARIQALAVSADGRRVAAGTQDGAILVLDPETGAVAATLRRSDAAVTALTWTAGGLVSGDNDGVIAVWDVVNPP